MHFVKKIFLLCLFLFSFHMQAFALKQPVSASILVAGVGEGMESRFGHVDLVLHYKKTPSKSDPVLRFGPHLEDNEKSSVLRYLGVRKKYPMGVWKSTFGDRLESYLIKEDRDIYRYQLKLTQNELRQLTINFYNLRSKKQPVAPYSLLFNNCSTLIADAIQSARIEKGRKIRGWSKRTPLRLGNLLKKRGLVSSSMTYPKVSTQRKQLLNNSKVRIDSFESAAVLSSNKYLRAFAINRISKKSTKLAKSLKARELDFPSRVYLRHVLKITLNRGTRLKSASFDENKMTVTLNYNGDRVVRQLIRLRKKLQGNSEIAISRWKGGAEVYLFEVFE